MTTLKKIVAELEATMRCTCDLSNWQPERTTGHSWVCNVHKAALERMCEKMGIGDNRATEMEGQFDYESREENDG